MKILEIEEVSKSFTGHQALSEVSFGIEPGTVYGLLGPNGAGKTTLLRIINHITAPDSGRVLFNGRQLTASDTSEIGYLPEERGLYKKMKVGDQALYFARLKGLSRQDAVKQLMVWFQKFGIESWWNRKVEELSKGMAQKVQFIVTVIHRPKLLIFDEPFSGFDPINANLLKEEIMGLKREGSTVIFSTHNMSSVEEVCDSITLLNKGRNVLTGKVEDLRREYFSDRYEMTVRGDFNALVTKLPTISDQIEVEGMPEGLTKISLHLHEGVSVKEAIALSNENSELRSFSPALATMNEIFIRTVGNTTV